MSQLFAMRASAESPHEVRRSFVAATSSDMNGDASVELLRTMAEVLDIRAVFPRVSAITSQVLAHDALALVFVDAANSLRLEARSADDVPQFTRLVLDGDRDFSVVTDLRASRFRFGLCQPADLVEQLADAGYRSLAVVGSFARRQAIGLMFLSKEPAAYSVADGPAAHKIADYVALAISHQQLADAERLRVEAQFRAERTDVRMPASAVRHAHHAAPLPVIGQSAEWKVVLKRAAQVASTEVTVFLHGESGTGKEIIARYIHRASARQAGPFVAINCAALPEHLLESELFGYERGAFTGAQQSKPGQIELASGGVLFLDEVSEMQPTSQAKLLRVLQEREFLRLGGTRWLKANVRVIAATNRDLRTAVAHGTFREDLYYRLQVFDIRMPPLRDRPGDIPLFVDVFLKEIGQSVGVQPAGVTPEVHRLLLAHTWPGNVRELRNVLERAAILCEGGMITPQHLSLAGAPTLPLPATTDLKAAERRTIEQVMHETDGNKAKAARRLGLTRTQLYVRLRKYDLDQANAS